MNTSTEAVAGDRVGTVKPAPVVTRSVLICGLGNLLRKDDGLGPQVIKELEGHVLPGNITLLDFGISGFKAALEIGNYDKVIFVDAMKVVGNSPGEVYRVELGREDIAGCLVPGCGSDVSLHETDLGQILATAASIGGCPKEVVVIGCEPADISLGLGLSGESEKVLGTVIDLVLAEVELGLPGV